jgi:hypothetical protein
MRRFASALVVALAIGAPTSRALTERAGEARRAERLEHSCFDLLSAAAKARS